MAFDVSFNREVLGAAGRYFSDAQNVRCEVESAEDDPAAARARGAAGQLGAARYDWDAVADRYEQLACRLVTERHRRRRRLSGRRSGQYSGSHICRKPYGPY